MSEIIRELFRGNLDVFERPFDADSYENETFNEMENLMERIKQKTPSEFHPLLDQYQTSMMNLMDAACEEEYLSGYQLGVRMMVAAWPDQQKQA